MLNKKAFEYAIYNMKYLYYSLLLILSFFVSCKQDNTPKKLPILGNRDFVNGDTVYHKIPNFSFINQDSIIVTNETFKGKAYVVDFFFTSCPTICPKVTKQMLRVYDQFKNNDKVDLVAYTIDPKHDTISVLRKYAQKLEVKAPKWQFLTGDKEKIYKIAEDYFSVAKESPDAPGGFDHSGRLILVDKNRLVRSFCDGTDAESVDRFMKDIDLLLKEN